METRELEEEPLRELSGKETDLGVEGGGGGGRGFACEEDKLTVVSHDDRATRYAREYADAQLEQDCNEGQEADQHASS
eukprot:756808-Hanusia_phi.AAC.1